MTPLVFGHNWLIFGRLYAIILLPDVVVNS